MCKEAAKCILGCLDITQCHLSTRRVTKLLIKLLRYIGIKFTLRYNLARLNLVKNLVNEKNVSFKVQQ